MRILLAEDDTDMRMLVAEFLTSRGHEVVACWNGLQGLKLYEDTPKPYDCVLSDWNMPVINGREMVDAILRQNPKQKVVMMTGDWSNKPPEGVRMIRKPFDRMTLLGAIEVWDSTTTA